MLTVSEALAAIVANVARLQAVRVPLDEALGLVLAEEAIADLDSPPFDKALMDGFAVRSSDVAGGRATLRVIEEVVAGQVPQRRVGAGEATRIMTGAPIPEGADAVVPVEQTRATAQHAVEIETTPTSPGRNILRRGESVRTGARVLPAGRLLRPQELGCLAELGKAVVAVFRRPRVAVLATGDELVPVETVPSSGQIRNSNETMLVAQLRQAGVAVTPLGIARDDAGELRERITAGLQCDVLILSGGVSAGKLDLVPSVLAELSVRQIFHKVRIKPGQPLWFGIHRSRTHQTTGTPVQQPQACYTFGLPGNPVSSMVCCELFVRTALRRLMGIETAIPIPVRARLTVDHPHTGNRPTYHPAKLQWTDQGPVVQTVRWIGSADLSATAEANAMALFPEGDRRYEAGTIVDAFPW
jgi:molybdopterin molybdotransferase